MTLLARIEPIAAEGAQRSLPDTGRDARLRVIVGMIADTVLPRNLVFSAAQDMSCTLTVASGRLMRMSVTTPDGHQVLSAAAGSTRDDQLAVLCEALAGLAEVEGPLGLDRHPLAEEVAADDVGHGAGEIRDLMETVNWFAEEVEFRHLAYEGAGAAFHAAAHPFTLAQTLMSPDGARIDATGAEAYQLSQADGEALASALAALPDDVRALLGPRAAIALPGAARGDRGLVIAVSPDDLAVNVGEGEDLHELLRRWLQAEKAGGPEK
ncbi:hypothetical protein OU426_15480 [Frigidibacter sp. RF13]|nr:hypothetical protein [Frigidibacter sp. RF13]